MIDETEWRRGEARAILDRAPLGYLAVMTGEGPHLTPQLMSVAAGRLWFVASCRSLRVGAIRARPGVAVSAWVPGTGAALVVHGDAHVLDLGRPFELGRTSLEAVLGAVGLARYVSQHLVALTRTFAQGATGQLASVLERRVLIGVQPDRATVVEVPAGADAVLGWVTAGGPLAVPVVWDEQASTARLSPGGRRLLEASPACEAAVTADRSPGHDSPADRSPGVGSSPVGSTGVGWSGVGAADREGAMFRGRARLDGDLAVFDVDRVTTWSGDRVETQAV